MANAPRKGPEIRPAPLVQPTPAPARAPAPRKAPASEVGVAPQSNALASRAQGQGPARPHAPDADQPRSNATQARVAPGQKDARSTAKRPAPAKGPAGGAAPADESAKAPPPRAEAPAGKAGGKAKGPAGKGGDRAAPGGDEGAGAAPAGAAAGPSAGPVLLMPEPPATLSPAAQKRLDRVQQATAQSATAHADLPAAETQTTQARGAVTPPVEETNAQASAELIAELDKEEPPSPEIEELCQKIYKAINDRRPPDEDDLVKADPQEMAKAAGAELNQTVDGDTQRVAAGYDGLQQQPKGEPAQPGQAPPVPPAAADAPAQAAAAAAPDAVPPENVSLDADVAANEKRMADAGMDTENARAVKTGPIAEARAAHGELQAVAERDPAEVLAEQQSSVAQSQADMAELQKSALQALRASRRATISDNSHQQTDMVGSEEKLRAKVGKEARGIFTTAQADVRKLLQPLAAKAMRQWTDGVAVQSTKFKTRLSKVEGWIKERHKGVVGTLVSIGDAISGLPGWVTVEYDAAEKDFGDGVCALVRGISKDVNGIIAACEAIINDANQRIDDLFKKLPEGLQEWAQGEQSKFHEQLNGLRTEARQTRDNFNKDLVKRAGQAVHEVRTQIHALREKAKGLIGRIADAIGRFLDDPIKFLIEALLDLLGIPPADFWALVAQIQHVIKDIADDPEKFTLNLLAAVKQGFGLFFDNIGTHLLEGMLKWLLSGLKDVGVEIPKDISLKSIITFFLQLMGISWTRIRKLLAKHVGEENVALIEKAWSVISALIEQGPEGIFEMLKDKLDPQAILDTILQVARDALIEALIKKAVEVILSLFNPVGAAYQLLKILYSVLKWIMNNAARIFRLIETLVKGIGKIVTGDTGGMAKDIEKALASLLVTVIDFIAEYLGIGDLPDKIKGAIEKFQTWVEGILDKVIKWLVDQGKALLKAVGIGGEKDKKPEQAGAVGEDITFTAGEETHKLYIVVEGGDAKVMLASSPAAVVNFLDSERVKKGIASGVEGLSDKVVRAKQLASKADVDAQRVLEHMKKPEPASSEKDNDNVKTEEQELADLLREIIQKISKDGKLSIFECVGKAIDDVPDAPDGYVISGDGQTKDIRRGSGRGKKGAEKGEDYPEVHTTEEGIIAVGKGTKRSDWVLIQEFREAVASLDPAAKDGDEAPVILGNPETLVNRVLGGGNPASVEGIRAQMRGTIKVIVSGGEVTGIEVSLGERRSVDYTLVEVREGRTEQVMVEYKHWTGKMGPDRLRKLSARLREQISAYLRLGRQYDRLVLEWPAFGSLSGFAKGAFRAVFIGIKNEAEGLNRITPEKKVTFETKLE